MSKNDPHDKPGAVTADVTEGGVNIGIGNGLTIDPATGELGVKIPGMPGSVDL